MINETKENALQKGKQAVQENCQQNAQAQFAQDNSARWLPALTFKEIAISLGVSPQAVEETYRRAIRKLRDNPKMQELL